VLAARLVERIRRDGPIGFDDLVAAALYDPELGFYATSAGAGRRGGDFVTSPEVGPLFGAVVARALDAWWAGLGEPDPYLVIEAGAGRGTLARSVQQAGPACAPALRYVTVERDDEMPAPEGPAVVLANELLDNLPFGLAERRDGRWFEVVVDVDDGEGQGEGDRLVERLGPLIEIDVEIDVESDFAAPDGARVPIQRAAADWLRRALTVAGGGRVVVIDYASTTPAMALRPATDWLRTYRGHRRGTGPLEDVGVQDITVEVAVDQLAAVRRPDLDRSQADFLAAHGLAELVEEGRRIWAERAHVGDLRAVAARSRVSEAAALTDPTGLGAFRVMEWGSDA
jgi:SAM-dependent MidA family methyltransferase